MTFCSYETEIQTIFTLSLLFVAFVYSVNSFKVIRILLVLGGIFAAHMLNNLASSYERSDFVFSLLSQVLVSCEIFSLIAVINFISPSLIPSA